MRDKMKPLIAESSKRRAEEFAVSWESYSIAIREKLKKIQELMHVDGLDDMSLAEADEMRQRLDKNPL